MSWSHHKHMATRTSCQWSSGPHIRPTFHRLYVLWQGECYDSMGLLSLTFRHKERKKEGDQVEERFWDDCAGLCSILNLHSLSYSVVLSWKYQAPISPFLGTRPPNPCPSNPCTCATATAHKRKHTGIHEGGGFLPSDSSNAFRRSSRPCGINL